MTKLHRRHGPTSLRLPLQGMGTQPAAQPLNVSAGMLLSCMAGLIARVLLGAYVIVAAPLSVALSITAMQLTRTIHRECFPTWSFHIDTDASSSYIEYIESPTYAGVPQDTIFYICAKLLPFAMQPPEVPWRCCWPCLSRSIPLAQARSAPLQLWRADRAAWCIQPEMESSFCGRLVHGLELTASAVIGQAVLFVGALVANNIGPASRKYPVTW